MINLLAAGGFEMPAVMLLLLVCVASGLEPADDKLIPIRQARPSRRLVAGGVTAIYVAACLAVVKFGLIPVAAAERSLLVSKDIMHSQRILHAALDAAKVAADADPLGVSSRQQIAELELQRLSQLELLVIQNKTTHTQEPLEADNDKDAIDQMKVAIDQALEACENLISADRRSSTGHRIRTSCLLIGARVLNDSTMLKEAIASQQLVVGMNPTSVHDWLDLAKLCQSAPANSAAPLALAAAQRALELEAINRDWGHQDQFLTPQDLGLLTNLNEQ
jgi:hypothetical protein